MSKTVQRSMAALAAKQEQLQVLVSHIGSLQDAAQVGRASAGYTPDQLISCRPRGHRPMCFELQLCVGSLTTGPMHLFLYL